MNQITKAPHALRDTQIPMAFSFLQSAMAEHIEDLNIRFNAGLTIRKMQTTFEVHELKRAEAVVSVTLTGKDGIQYRQFLRRDNALLSGMIYVRASLHGSPVLMFADFPHANVQVSYQDASKRLLDFSW